jgi:hypothetical protein
MSEKEDFRNEKSDGTNLLTITDSTSVGDVQIFINTHVADLLDEPNILKQVDRFIQTPIPEKKWERETLLDSGVNLLQHFSKNVDKAYGGIEGVFAVYAIKLGQLLHYLKKLTRRLGLREWNRWATENLKFLGQRTRINYMEIADRPDCHAFALLGMERLLLLIRATRDWKGNDRIGEFMRKYQIKFDPESRETLKAFKTKVDTAINLEKLEKLKLNVPADPKLVEGLTEHRHIFDNDLLTTIKKIDDSKGDLNKYLNRLVINKGKEKSPFEGQKVIQDFNDVGAHLLKILDYMDQHEEAHETVEVEIVEELIERLNEFKKKVNNA